MKITAQIGEGSLLEYAVLLKAAVFAAEKHKMQVRKDPAGSPYINHPLKVAELLASIGGVTDTSLLVAALLHDVVEDTDATVDEVRNEFGRDVSMIVSEVTDDKSLPKQKRKELQIKTAAQKSAEAKQLKIADKICNLKDICGDAPTGWDLNRKLEYLEWSRRVVAGCQGINQSLDQAFEKAVSDAESRLGISGSG